MRTLAAVAATLLTGCAAQPLYYPTEDVSGLPPVAVNVIMRKAYSQEHADELVRILRNCINGGCGTYDYRRHDEPSSRYRYEYRPPAGCYGQGPFQCWESIMDRKFGSD